MSDLRDIHDELKKQSNQLVSHSLDDSLHFQKLDDHFTTIEDRLLDQHEGVLPRIERQVAYTNGRVRWTEKMIWLAIGGLGVLTALVIPVLLALIKTGKV